MSRPISTQGLSFWQTQPRFANWEKWYGGPSQILKGADLEASLRKGVLRKAHQLVVIQRPACRGWSMRWWTSYCHCWKGSPSQTWQTAVSPSLTFSINRCGREDSNSVADWYSFKLTYNAKRCNRTECEERNGAWIHQMLSQRKTNHRMRSGENRTAAKLIIAAPGSSTPKVWVIK